jgi:CheY-like chemotaxis protein
MPKISGSELSQELALRATPVIVMITSNQDRHRVKADSLNLAGYILKPFTLPNVKMTAMLNKYWILC